MQVLCKSINGSAEAHCCMCGKGFIIFWERQLRMDRAEAPREIQKVLLRHHRTAAGPQAHPQCNFLVPQWNGPVALSRAAVPGYVPTWSL
jgi:hypothetical protein